MIIAKAEDQTSRVGLEGKVLPAFRSVLAQDRGRAGGRCDWALPKVQVPSLSHIIPVYWGIFIATIEVLPPAKALDCLIHPFIAFWPRTAASTPPQSYAGNAIKRTHHLA